MSFLSGLKVFGKGIEHVFGWMGSTTGQRVIGAGEALVETIAPASIPVIDLANAWAKRMFFVQAIAASAAQGAVSGADKAALVIEAVTPTVLQYAQQEGLQARTPAQIQTANDALVAFVKAMTETAPAV